MYLLAIIVAAGIAAVLELTGYASDGLGLAALLGFAAGVIFMAVYNRHTKPD